MKPLKRSFYSRDTAIVTEELLGKILVRRFDDKILSGKIVETEAYYGEDNPAPTSIGLSFRKTFSLCSTNPFSPTSFHMTRLNFFLPLDALT